MTPDTPDDDPPAAPAVPAAAAAGFQRTEWSSARQGSAAPNVPSTVLASAAPPDWQHGGSGLPPGTRLNELEITAQLGEGGFGIVYLCTDHALQRRVALKEYMPSQLCGRLGDSQVQVKSERHRDTFEAGRKSFINEARLLASFDHPSLVKVYRFWEANGTAYMVMPFYEGKTLRDTLRGMPQAPDEAWLRALLAPLTEALAVIHAERCYHRDIAPDNVMMLAAGNPAGRRPLLLDFGAARRVIGDMTQALTVYLKPGYAPIEQYAEIPGMKQGPWTDVYALAAVVYFAILGRTPPASVGRLLDDRYEPLAQAAAGRYSTGFLAAIDRALAVRPEQRTPDIAALRGDLGLDPGAVDPRPPQPLLADPPAAPQRAVEPTVVMPGALPPSAFAVPAAAHAQRAATAAQPPPRTPEVPVVPLVPLVPLMPEMPLMPAMPLPGKAGRAMLGMAAAGLLAAGVAGYLLWTPAQRPPAPGPAPAVAPSPAAPAPAAQVFDPGLEFAKVVQAQTPGFDVRLQTNRSRYRIDKDELRFTIHSAREGYVHVFIHGADHVLLQLYPNDKQPALKIRPGQTLTLPQLPDVLTTTAPAGPTDLLVIVSPLPRDHGALQPRAEGGYRVYPTGAAAAALVALNPGPHPASLVQPAQPVMAGRVACPAGGACDAGYGAALARVEVVP